MFGKSKERRRQWSLLGILLMNLQLPDALDFMDAAFGSSTVNWLGIRGRVLAGGGLFDAAKDPAHQTPPEVLEALEDGEEDGRLPERLGELEIRMDAPAAGAEEDPAAATAVNRLFQEAVEQGAGGLLLLRKPTGEGELKILHGEVWSPHSRYAAAECAALVRRVWILAGQPYWAPKPGVIRMRIAQGTIELRVTPGQESGLGVEIVTVSARSS